ncbi:hypothetical protein ROZALSC1DRAFT_30171, partial [Rozella allomycis CSF55]
REPKRASSTFIDNPQQNFVRKKEGKNGWIKISTEFKQEDEQDLITLQKLNNKEFILPIATQKFGFKYAVLEGNTLFFYDDDKKKECIGVAVLDSVNVSFYPEDLTDPELYLKEFPLRLESNSGSVFNNNAECYLYAPSCYEKEEWYLALKSVCFNANKIGQETIGDINRFMDTLIRKVESPFYDDRSKWFNAILGRIFLNIWKARVLEEKIIQSFNRKTKRLKKPSFLGPITIKDVDMGNSLPQLENPSLLLMELDGTLMISGEIRFNGCVKVIIETEATIDTRMKSFNVNLRLKVILRKFTAKALFKVKPPPSDRLWIGFYEPPVMEIDIEPMISQTAITWSVITQLIERRIHDTMQENFLLPNMDDISLPEFTKEKVNGECNFENGFVNDSSTSSLRVETFDEYDQSSLNEKPILKILTSTIDDSIEITEPDGNETLVIKRDPPMKTRSVISGMRRSFSDKKLSFDGVDTQKSMFFAKSVSSIRSSFSNFIKGSGEEAKDSFDDQKLD